MVLTRRETTSSSTVTSGKIKEVTKKGKLTWRVGNLLADEMQPGGPRLLAKHPRRKDSSTGGGELGEAEVEEMGDWEEQAQ